MEIRYLRTLMAIADAGSFAVAAQRLLLTPSAVSMQMRALEKKFRTVLFDHSRRPPLLNERGWQIAQDAARVVAQYDALMDAVVVTKGQLVGSLRLGVLHSMTTSVLPRALARLHGEHPALRIVIESGVSPDLKSRLLQGQLDAVVATQADRLEIGLVEQTIYSEELKLIAPKRWGHASARKHLAARPFIRFNGMMGVGRLIAEALDSRDLAVNEIMSLDSIAAIAMMVALELGVAIVPDNSIPDSVRERLAVIPLDAPPTFRRIALVTKKKTRSMASIEAVHRHLKAAFLDLEQRPPAKRRDPSLRSG